jgi:DNA anti-recombination protein RmuC
MDGSTVKSIKQIAMEQNVSYESIRRLIVKYHDELRPHISRVNKTQYIDEEGYEFLKSKRRESPLVLLNEDKNEQLERYKAEADLFKTKLMEAQQQIIELQQAKLEATEARIKFELLQESHDRLKEEASKTAEELKEVRERSADELKQLREQSAEELKQAQSEAAELSVRLRLSEIDKEAAEKELNSFHRSLFGFYRKD